MIKSVARGDRGVYQCLVYGENHDNIAIGSSQLDLGGNVTISPYEHIKYYVAFKLIQLKILHYYIS